MKTPAILLLAFLYLISCKKQIDKTTSTSPYSSLKADSTNLSLDGSFNSIDSFKIYYSGQWTLSLSPGSVTWIKLDTTAGTGSSMIHIIAVEANKTSSLRTAKIVINSKDNSVPGVTINVSQLVEKQWQQMASLPGIGRIAASSFSIGDNFYVGLGRGSNSSGESDLNDFYRYNIVSNTWTQLPNFPGGAREFAKGFAINGKGYIAMGQSYNYANIKYYDVWQFDPQDTSWTKVTTFSNIDDNIPITSGLFVTDTKAYILYFKSLYEFDPSDYSLTPKAAFPATSPDLGPYYFAINNKAYQVSDIDNVTNLKTVYEYDATNDSWAQKNDFPGQGRAAAYSFVINGMGYIACGDYSSNPTQGQYVAVGLNDVWEYNPSTDKWRQIADFPGTQYGGVSGVVNGRAIIGTGESQLFQTPYPSNAFWIY